MPFKGDTRLGGRHNNVATLNGTSSEFNSVPAVGTVLSGPTDTSRYVNDFLGQPFYMPYSTTVYADGLGGENPVETWGLEYLPAGWVTTTSNLSQTGTYSYTTQFENYTPDGEFTWGYETLAHTEDGTGINYTVVASETVTMQEGLVLASDTGGTGADRYRVVFNSAAVGRTELQDFTMHPVFGDILGYYSDPVNYTATCQTFQIGVDNGVYQADGYGGQFASGGVTWDSPSYLGHCGNQVDGWEFYHHDGNGNVALGQAPAGFLLYSDSGSSSFPWSAPDGTSGTFNYATSENFQNADGNGGINYNGNSWNATEGDVITSGTYVSGQTYDPSTDSYIDDYSPYNLTYIYQNDSHTYITNYP